MAISFIYNEQLTGTVNGVNTVFTSANTIDEIESMRLWGAEYSGFSFTGNTVTLTDAPTVGLGSPYIDYFIEAATPTPSSSTVTFWDLRSQIYEDIGQDDGSPQYPVSMVDRYIIETIPLHLNQKVNPIRKVWQYSFNKAIDPTVSAYSATQVDVTDIPTYTPATGAILIGDGHYVEYSTVSATAFTSISSLGYVYDADDMVTIGYTIPSGIQKVSEVFLGRKRLTFVDRREFIVSLANNANYFTIIDWFLFLPRTAIATTVIVNFTYEATIPTDDTDLIDFEPNYQNVLRYDVLRRMYQAREDTRLATTEVYYKESLKAYKSYISKQVDKINWTIKSADYSYLSPNSYGYSRNNESTN